MAEFAVDRYAAAHQARIAAGSAPDPRPVPSPLAARRVADLAKILEERLHILGADPYAGVAHRDLDPFAAADPVAARRERDEALRS